MSAFASKRSSQEITPQKPGDNVRTSPDKKRFDSKKIDLASLKIAKNGETIQAFIQSQQAYFENRTRDRALMLSDQQQ